MITVDKIKELQKLLRKGVPDGEIKEQLIRDDFSFSSISVKSSG